MIKLGINGFGRFGRMILRACLQNSDLEITAINDPAIDVEYICYLIKFDSTHGKFKGSVEYAKEEILVNDKRIKVFREKFPAHIPWQTAGVQYVVESSGMFTTLEKASGHLASESVKRVLLTAPSIDVPMIILGVNDNELHPGQKVISCTSSTLYCLAPIIKILEDNFGVAEGFVTSIHAMTPSLKPLDGLCLRGKQHWRDHRSIHQNIIPAATGACKAIGKIIPRVKDRLAGIAFRVPIVNVSVLDISIRLSSDTTLQEIIEKVKIASKSILNNIITFSKEDAVSSDFMGETHSCVLDVDSSIQLKPNFFKLVCWYENEYSYACRVIDSIYLSENKFIRTITENKFTRTITINSQMKNDSVEQNKYSKEVISSSISQDTGFKFKGQSHKMLLKKPLSSHLPGTTNTNTKYFNKRDEMIKILTDLKEKPIIRQNTNSLFHNCITISSKNKEEIDCEKAQERLQALKNEFSKLVSITENLLKKSYVDNLQIKAGNKPVEILNKHVAKGESFGKSSEIILGDYNSLENQLGDAICDTNFSTTQSIKKDQNFRKVDDIIPQYNMKTIETQNKLNKYPISSNNEKDCDNMQRQENKNITTSVNVLYVPKLCEPLQEPTKTQTKATHNEMAYQNLSKIPNELSQSKELKCDSVKNDSRFCFTENVKKKIINNTENSKDFMKVKDMISAKKYTVNSKVKNDNAMLYNKTTELILEKKDATKTNSNSENIQKFINKEIVNEGNKESKIRNFTPLVQNITKANANSEDIQNFIDKEIVNEGNKESKIRNYTPLVQNVSKTNSENIQNFIDKGIVNEDNKDSKIRNNTPLIQTIIKTNSENIQNFIDKGIVNEDNKESKIRNYTPLVQNIDRDPIEINAKYNNKNSPTLSFMSFEANASTSVLGVHRASRERLSLLSDCTSKYGSPDNTSLMSNIEVCRHKDDIYDKLDSISCTDSNNSFQIDERKSQVINISDLTSSLEDLARLDKICKIIEISDELSNKLFATLDNPDAFDIKKKKWSFKDLCTKIKLDDFCNSLFKKTKF